MPIFYFYNESLQIEEPSQQTKKWLSEQTNKKFEPMKHEISRIIEEKSKDEREKRLKNKMQVLREKRKFGFLLKKKARGPNPLSTKKKISKNDKISKKTKENEVEKKEKKRHSRTRHKKNY